MPYFHKMITQLIITIVLLHLVSGCASKGMINLQTGNRFANSNWMAEKPSFSVPFSWHDGHIIIDVYVNGSEPLRFAFDSAAAATVLFETPRTATLDLAIEQQLPLQNHQVNVVNNGGYYFFRQ